MAEKGFWDEFDEETPPVAEDADLTDLVGQGQDWETFEREQENRSQQIEAIAPSSSIAEESEESPVLKGEIEALLFMTNRPLHLEDMALMLNRPLDEVVDAMSELLGDYAFRGESSLEIEDGEEGYILQVRRTYQHLVNKMMPMDLSTASLRTLSVIAIKAPILQKELIDLRGSTAYDHVKELLSHKLISKNRHGSSYRLNLTPTFHQLFKLSGDKKELDVLVDTELAVERETRQRIMATSIESPEALESLSLSVALDD
jgi:segregation and condensation protein B